MNSDKSHNILFQRQKIKKLQDKKIKLRLSKKAAVEIQFNWIFVVIVGAIILLFFYSIVKAQQRSSNEEMGYSTAVDLNTIFNSALESTNALNRISIPETTLDFTCHDFVVNGVNKNFKEKIVFAPNRLQGKELLGWAVDWQAPFKVTNFFFITSEKVRYVLVNDSIITLSSLGANVLTPSEAATRYYDYIPEELNVQVMQNSDPDSIFDQNEYKTRIVYFMPSSARFDPMGTDEEDKHLPFPGPLLSKSEESVTAIIIQTDNLEQGMIHFYQRGNDYDFSDDSAGLIPAFEYVGSFPFLMHETALAAMFSENQEEYSCSIKKAVRKLKIVTQVYKMRTEVLDNYYSTTSDLDFICMPYVTQANIINLNQSVTQLDQALTNGSDLTILKSKFNSVFNNVILLQAQNKELIGNSCSRLY